jgi:SNF2 family DNA or RNA helicase
MGGKPKKLWPVLHWLAPEDFPSEWRWVNKWLKTETGFSEHSKIVGALQKGIEQAFAKAHARHMIRRTKLSVLPGLPQRIEEVRWCKMTPKQKEQYVKFAAELEIRIDEERLSANNVLSEYTRLKQFANAMQKMNDGIPYPTANSGKLADIEEILDENGIRRVDPEPGARAILGTESLRFANMIYAWLTAKKIPCELLTGETKDSEAVIRRFKHGGEEQFVIVTTVQTGGTSLDLEESQAMIAMDETWNPDDLEQFFERGDRSTRTTPLRCYILRTRDTIQEYIAAVNEGKSLTNATVLDVRRKMHEMEMI